MNLFETASSLKAVSDSKKRKGSSASLAETITVPYFKGLYRRGDKYSVTLTKTLPAIKADKEAGIKASPATKKEVSLQVKPLAGAFILSYFTCLASCLCKEANQPLTTFVVQALIGLEGFSLADYAQGKTTGAKRVETHLKAMNEQRGLNISVNNEGLIAGLSDAIVDDVLSAI